MNYQQYAGVPFRRHGRDLHGWDCWGLYRHIYNDFTGLLLPEYAGSYQDVVQDRKQIGEYVKHQLKQWSEIPKFSEEEGDLIVLRVSGLAMHVGYVLPGNQFIHCESNNNTVIENYTHALWKNRVLGFHRYE